MPCPRLGEVLVEGKAAASDHPGTAEPCGVGCWPLIALERFQKEAFSSDQAGQDPAAVLALSDALSFGALGRIGLKVRPRFDPSGCMITRQVEVTGHQVFSVKLGY